MAYDEELAELVRELVEAEPGLSEKRMFGGLAFMIGGHLALSASGRGGLLVRVDPAQTGDLVTDPLAERFVMRGREMDGWLHIDVDATVTEEELQRWVSLGITYARSLPPKS
jgi:hypothetical protein